MKFGMAIWMRGQEEKVLQEVRKAWAPVGIDCDRLEIIPGSFSAGQVFCIAHCRANLFQLIRFMIDQHLHAEVYITPENKLMLLIGY